MRGPNMPAPAGAGVLSVRSPAHGGPAAARNAGSAIAAGDVIVFVDADVAVKPDVFEHLREHFADPAVDAVFGSYCDRPHAPGVVSGFRNLLHHYVHQNGAGPAETFWTGLGAIRRELLLSAGGLDDGLRYLEDLELGRRLSARGARILLDPAVQGTHLKGYDLHAMVRTDLKERAIPWVRLALEGRATHTALNAGGRHRASALASVSVVGGLLARRPWVSAAGTGAMVAMNHDFYALLRRQLGWRGAAYGPPLHVLHHLTALSGIAPAIVLHLVEHRRETRVVAPEVLQAAAAEPVRHVPVNRGPGATVVPIGSHAHRLDDELTGEAREA